MSEYPREVADFLAPPRKSDPAAGHHHAARMAIDAFSQTWFAVAGWANTEIERARASLETPGLPPHEYDVYRGRIAVLRDLLSIGSADKTQVD